MVFRIGHALRPIRHIAIKLRWRAFEIYDQITWPSQALRPQMSLEYASQPVGLAMA
jgi:hypothetical protein